MCYLVVLPFLAYLKRNSDINDNDHNNSDNDNSNNNITPNHKQFNTEVHD